MNVSSFSSIFLINQIPGVVARDLFFPDHHSIVKAPEHRTQQMFKGFKLFAESWSEILER
jgi:hypothetical protein